MRSSPASETACANVRAPAASRLGEVGPVQGVHQEVGGVAAGHGVSQGGRVGDVAEHGLAGALVKLRASGHGAYRVTRLLERRAEPTADEAGCARDEHLPAFSSAEA